MKRFKDFVRQKWLEWGQAGTSHELHDKIVTIQKEIRDWTNQRFGKIKEQIIVCRDYMEWIGKVEEIRSITNLEKMVHVKVKRRYVQLSVMEEEIWRQRAKIRWENKGDKNTSYFHSLATAAKRGNSIPVVKVKGRRSDLKKERQTYFGNFILISWGLHHKECQL